MKLSDFDYILPEELIAQKPLGKRDASRLLTIDKSINCIEHKHFYDIADMLTSNDILVYNDTKVIPARLIGESETGSKIELLLIEKTETSYKNRFPLWRPIKTCDN